MYKIAAQSQNAKVFDLNDEIKGASRGNGK